MTTTITDKIATLTARLQASRKGTLLECLRASNRPRPNFDHLNDPDLWTRFIARSGVVEGYDDDAVVPAPVKRKRAAPRPTLRSVAKQATTAGISVRQYDFHPCGKISAIVGEPEPLNAAAVPQIDASEWN